MIKTNGIIFQIYYYLYLDKKNIKRSSDLNKMIIII